VTDKFTALTPDLHDYLVDRGAREDEVLARVREETAALGDVAVMQVSPDQGAFLRLLVLAIGARSAIELGTFTGYSAICIARGLPADGELVCCELDPERADVARHNLEAAGVAERADVRVGPALETLQAIPEEPAFDFAFIDADKPGYPAYYEAVLPRLRSGGLIAIDNVLMGGRVLEPAADDASALSIDALNRAIEVDDRVDVAMLGVADGLTLARKRGPVPDAAAAP